MPIDFYRTTRPILPPARKRKVIEFSSGLGRSGELRVLEESDLNALHLLRTQREVMINTSQGQIDQNLDVTRTWMQRFLPPNDTTTFNWCIWVKVDGRDWEHIGVLGVHTLSPVPFLGYMIRREWWGQGIVRRATQSFLQAYWNLDRQCIDVHTSDVSNDEDDLLKTFERAACEQRTDATTPEALFAKTASSNGASTKILKNSGFKQVNSQIVTERRFHEYDVTTAIVTYILTRPRQ